MGDIGTVGGSVFAGVGGVFREVSMIGTCISHVPPPPPRKHENLLTAVEMLLGRRLRGKEWRLLVALVEAEKEA